MARIAYFVVHPESSGGRMMTEFIIRSGAFGEHTHDQDLGSRDFKDRPDRIVFRRSLPHGGTWSNLRELAGKMEKADYTVIPIAIFRDRYSTARSQVFRGHVETIEKAIENMDQAAAIIAWHLRDYHRIVIISYERFVTNSLYRELVAERIGILPPIDMTFWDANKKYYDEETKV